MLARGTLSTVLVVVGACAPISGEPHHSKHVVSPKINHVVLIQLDDPDGAEDLMDDCDRLLPAIPVVQGYWCGQHGDFGRTTVDGDYDVALYVGFASGDDYATYVDHENHVELIRIWKPKIRWLRVHDVVERDR